MKTVMVAGKFDPVHEGHIEHIRQAAALGDWLIVVTHTDEVVKLVKGRCAVPFWAREAILQGLLLRYNIKGVVTRSVDTDGTVARTIQVCRPRIFAKGGDRTPDNMPQSEIDACREVDCQIVYGVGEKLNSSSLIM